MRTVPVRLSPRWVEIALLVVVQFEGDKLAHEHLYWDQASVLVQLGLLSLVTRRGF
jgi:hypothetical protein